MGTPTSAPNTMTAVALRSACFHAFGNQRRGRDEIDDQQQRRDQPRRRDAARQRHEDQRGAETGKSARRSRHESDRADRDGGVMLTRRDEAGEAHALAGHDVTETAHARHHAAQHAAGLLRHLGHDLRGHRVDLLIGQGLLARLDRHRDRDRLLALVDALAFIDVEHGDIGDQLLVDALRRAHDIAGLDAAIDDEGKVARHRLERREFEHRLGAGRLLLGVGNAVEDHLERDQRTVGARALPARADAARRNSRARFADRSGWCRNVPDAASSARRARSAAPASARRRPPAPRTHRPWRRARRPSPSRTSAVRCPSTTQSRGERRRPRSVDPPAGRP